MADETPEVRQQLIELVRRMLARMEPEDRVKAIDDWCVLCGKEIGGRSWEAAGLCGSCSPDPAE